MVRGRPRDRPAVIRMKFSLAKNGSRGPVRTRGVTRGSALRLYSIMKIGIDLGTTNCALAYIDEREAEDVEFPPVHVFEAPQLVAAGRVEPRRTLPSFLFLEDGEPVGAYAREQGALVPTRLVHSAKSWLSNPDVDRTAKILPWDSPETGRVLSPVEVSARYLAKFREEWDRAKSAPLAEQDIVLTVPASFDEEARELTVMAAKEAGIERLTLLEEPAAAFYSWIANNLAQSRKKLFDGQVVLVCDVGGGTSDFSLIRVAREGDLVNFTRTAVGKHLLLGGDNLDLTLAWLVETKLNAQLTIRQRSGLRRQCSAAKEKLLNDPHLKSVEITVLGTGSSLIGKSLKSEILREEALELALEGFLPFTERGEAPKEEKRSLFRELGLPYVSDAAITRHLNAFLEPTGETPDAILFNGGFFIPEILRERVAEAVGRWYGRRPEIFENVDLDLAVARGAAYYSYVRSTGSGVLVRGGLPRTYYIGLGEAREGKFPAVCLVPRGAEEGASVEVDNGALQLVANRPVSFRLYSSLTRTEDKLGDVLEFGADDASLHGHAPLHAVIRFGKKAEERLIPVKLGARLTELGTLETWCESKISENRWRLQFELRKRAAQQPAERKAAAVVSEQALKSSLASIGAVFSPGAKSPGPGAPRRKNCLRSWSRPWDLAATPGRSPRFARWRMRSSPWPTDARRALPTKRAGSTCAGSVCAPASAIPATISALSRHARSTPRASLTATRRSAKSIGGSSGDASPAASTATSRPTCISAWQRLCCRAVTRSRSASIRRCCAKCGAPRPAWSCCPWARRRSWAKRSSSESNPAITKRASCGAWRGWARASSSMGPSIWWSRPRPRRDGPKRC